MPNLLNFWGFPIFSRENTLPKTKSSPVKMVDSKSGISKLPRGPYFQGRKLAGSFQGGRVKFKRPIFFQGPGRLSEHMIWWIYLEDHPRTCKWLVTPIYKPFRPFGRGITLLRGRFLTMVINHLQVMG